MNNILQHLPYGPNFRFVDELTFISKEEVKGCYTYQKDAYFYEDHFPGNPVTPGVILIETMAQIGLVCLGIYLLKDQYEQIPPIAFTSSNVTFYKMVLPGEKVVVHSHKKVFRLGKLKCDVEMRNEQGDLVARGELSGMTKRPVTREV